MNIFKKWKKYFDKEAVINLSYKYDDIELDKPIKIDNIFIVKKNNSLIFFVKKDKWKKYVGVTRTYLSDSQGNDFSHNSFYKSADLENIEFCYHSSIPNELIYEMFDELIEYKFRIEIALKDKMREEFYK